MREIMGASLMRVLPRIKYECGTGGLRSGRLRWVVGCIGGRMADDGSEFRRVAWHVGCGVGTEWIEEGAAACEDRVLVVS